MIEEMQAKFNRLSQSLIDGLQEREEMIQEREVRHKFIAAVHQLVQHRQSHSFGQGGGPNLTVKELKRLASKRNYTKEKSPVKVSCSGLPFPVVPPLYTLYACVFVCVFDVCRLRVYQLAVRLCIALSPQYLPTVIPYTARPIQVPWNLDTLEKLTRSMTLC